MINIKADSRKIVKGDIFVALRGISSDGHDYIDKAIANGATKLIVEEEKDYPIDYEVVSDTREYLTKYLIDNYSYMFKEMKVIGITGTNGKTTTAFLLYQALNKLGNKAAYIGTLGFFQRNGKVCSLPNTSPDICDLYELFSDCYDKGYDTVIIEASSQGLVRGRLKGITFDYGIFTNLTLDHLDEHGTMENYAKAKRLLFDNLKEDGIAIVNYDDRYKKYYACKNTLYYGFTGGDFKVDSAKYSSENTIFNYSYDNNNYQIVTSLLGDYNIYNILCVVIILTLMKYDNLSIKKVISTLENPNGRLDIVKYKTSNIIIDYAHTPDAVEKVLKTASLIGKGNIYTVFGCTGERERGKRPMMMQIVTKNSKYVIVTIDDPHNEDLNLIVKDMLLGNHGNNYEIILDRGKAIEKGIELLKDNDTLLILGKGHEEYIIMGKEKIPFNDKKQVEKVLLEKE